MGYTHHWYRPQKIRPSTFRAIVADFGKVKAAGIPLAGNYGMGIPTITNKRVVFNGCFTFSDGDQSCETFDFPLVASERSKTKSGRYFGACKTAGKLYDTLVVAFLIIAKHHLHDDIIVNTDGDDAGWGNGRHYVKEALGYGDEYKIVDNKLTHLPVRISEIKEVANG